MMKSNIVAGSNVFLSREEEPFRDPDFIAQIHDYMRVKELADRKKVDYKIPKLTQEQQEILRTELRCVYAKDDPCWGYSKKAGKVISACINNECPNLYKCNPHYSDGEATYWIASAQEKNQYGEPNKLRWYYLVDMVSDEEMQRYVSNPVNEGNEYPVRRNPVPIDESIQERKKSKTKIDPVTGRRMVVVGYRWTITDTASYENEQLLPIWGFVEETEETKQVQVTYRKKAKRIEKKEEIQRPRRFAAKEKEQLSDRDFLRKEEFEKAVSDNITGEIKLTDVEPDTIADTNTVILFDNPAELAFVSETFLASGITHGISSEQQVMLALIDDYRKYASRKNVMISSSVLKAGCKETNVQEWKVLSKKKDIITLRIADRDFYKFSYGNECERWTCRNMYGVTHVCVNKDDIQDINSISNGIHTVLLVEDGSTYMITDQNGTVMGHLGEGFVSMINALKEADEIPGSPAVIKGLSIRAANGEIELLGMGHLKFIEY